MTSPAIAFSRRSLNEKKILRVIRGLAGSGDDQYAARVELGRFGASTVQAEDFVRLVDTAVARDLEIRGCAAPFIAADELRLIGWLASAQRHAPPASMLCPDPAIGQAIDKAARLLNDLGIRMPLPTCREPADVAAAPARPAVDVAIAYAPVTGSFYRFGSAPRLTVRYRDGLFS